MVPAARSSAVTAKSSATIRIDSNGRRRRGATRKILRSGSALIENSDRRPILWRRTEQLVGRNVTFRDGSVWKVPQLVLWHDSESDDLPAVYSTPLPVMVDVDRFGNPIDGPVVKEYRELFDLGLRVLAKLAGNGDESLTGAQLMHFAANVIGMNYRVGLLEMSASVLDCLSTDDARKVMLAAIDWSGLRGRLGKLGWPAGPADYRFGLWIKSAAAGRESRYRPTIGQLAAWMEMEKLKCRHSIAGLRPTSNEDPSDDW